MFDRSTSTEAEIIDQWDGGFGWIAHPDEDGRRASHALRANDGVWIFDPLEAPEVYQRIAELGTVKGVVLLSSFHCRDTNQFADRYDVPVYLPSWMNRPTDEIEVPIKRFEAPPGEWTELAESGVSVRTIDSSFWWRETIAYHHTDGTLRVPDLLSPIPEYKMGDEQIGCYLFHRLSPPRNAFSDIDPDRILFGHGEGISEDAKETLDTTLTNARGYLPHALVFQLSHHLLAIGSAVRDELHS